jgi:mannose-6-phosphate isomerase-like protein (cupin superfamily)
MPALQTGRVISMIKNYLTARKQIQQSSHQGTGAVELYEIWKNSDFRSSVDFFDRVVVPPGSTIGFHKHGANEEMYIVLEGKGLMKIEDDEVSVGKGDMILNPAEGRHGLINNSAENMDILVIQIGINRAG